MAFEETEDDINRKYNKTYIKYMGHVVMFHSLEGANLAVHTAHGRTEIHPWEPASLVELSFDSCLINEDIMFAFPTTPCIQIARNPRRQWRRSICHDNVTILNPMDALLLKHSRRLVQGRELNFKVVQALFKKEYPSLDEAFKNLPKQVCVAVNPQYYLMLSNIHPKRALLGSLFGLIGEFHPTEGIIIHHQPALQECKDFVSRTQQYHSVCLK